MRRRGPRGQEASAGKWEVRLVLILVIWLSDRPGRTLVQRGLHKA